ncbi:hypothetical protein INR49_001140 [Caranx melampygus]|nr:hypothetical protein INR49_001140 [Caranx melampygus]
MRGVPLSSTGQSRETAELEQLLESYKQGAHRGPEVSVGELSPQLLDSNKHKQELELQLTTLWRESRTSGQLAPPLCLEADVMPQMKKPELVSSQAQSLTRKYQETKELLKVQELKKRNMQAQLGLSLSHLPDKEPYFSEPQKPSVLDDPPPEPEQESISVMLQDRPDAIQELEGLISGEPITLMELGKVLKSHSCNRETPEKYQLQKVLETWRCQQEVENETIKKSLARAGESIRQYEARLLTMEDLVGKVQRQILRRPISPVSIENHPETTEKTVGMLSQRVELLTNENGALKQRCQEIVNQLTEADRE